MRRGRNSRARHSSARACRIPLQGWHSHLEAGIECISPTQCAAFNLHVGKFIGKLPVCLTHPPTCPTSLPPHLPPAPHRPPQPTILNSFGQLQIQTTRFLDWAFIRTIQRKRMCSIIKIRTTLVLNSILLTTNADPKHKHCFPSAGRLIGWLVACLPARGRGKDSGQGPTFKP